MNEAAALATLADIELPLPPEGDATIRLVIALLALTVIGLLLALAWSRRSRRRQPPVATPATSRRHQAMERLHALQAEWQQGGVDDREAAYRLGAILRLGFGLAQLDGESPATVADHAAWRRLIEGLRLLRYHPGHARLQAADFDLARAWLAGGQDGAGPAREGQAHA